MAVLMPPPIGDPDRREPIVDFVTLFHVASDPNLPWPEAVLAWGKKAPANNHLLVSIEAMGNHPTGGSAIMLLRLLDELLKAVNG